MNSNNVQREKEVRPFAKQWARITRLVGLRLVLSAMILASAQPGFANYGLRTKFAEVTVSNLKIGRRYSLNDLVNFPLRIYNTGSSPVDLKIDVVRPGGGENKAGYEPIPDPNWIHLQRSTFTVIPGLDAVTDVVIDLPNDEKLLGRRFCVYLWTQSQNIGSTGVGLKSRLLLSVSSQKPTAEELKKQFVQKRLANLNFSFNPMETEASNVPLGRRVELQDLKADVKLVNPNEETYNFRFTPVSIWETSITPPPGFEPAPDPKWLIVPQEVIKAKGESFSGLHLAVQIPDEEQYKNKAFILILRAEILEQDIPAYAYVRVLVRTGK